MLLVVFFEVGKVVVVSCLWCLFLFIVDVCLIVINVDNGKVCEDFGVKGVVDLMVGIGLFILGGYYFILLVVVICNLVIIGGYVIDNELINELFGVICVFDVYDGKLVWNWDSGNLDEIEFLVFGKFYICNLLNMWLLVSVDEKFG